MPTRSRTRKPKLSAWNMHVKRVAAKHPNLDFTQIIQLAKRTYGRRAA